MITWHPPTILFAIGQVSVHTYGVTMALAIGSAYLWTLARATAKGLPTSKTENVLFWAVVAGLIGARLGYVIQNIAYFTEHTQEIFAIWLGGLSFHGALIGGVIGGWLTLRHEKLTGKFWLLADSVSAPLLLAAAIGRLGNWANQELYGYPTNRPWAILIDTAHRLSGYQQFATFHPTFAYEALLNLLGVGIILWTERRQLAAGKITAFSLIWYALARGITEIWRISDRLSGPLSLAQLLSLAMIVLGIWIWRRQTTSST